MKLEQIYRGHEVILRTETLLRMIEERKIGSRDY